MTTSTRTVDAPTRIQLEGNLERVERQVEEWRAAAVALKLGSWEHDTRWLTLLHSAPAAADSVRVVTSKLLRGVNDGLLHELAAAQAMVAERATARLAALGRGPVTPGGALDLLRELKHRRPLHVVYGQLASSRLDLGGRLIVAGFGGASIWLALTVAGMTLDPNHSTPSALERLALALGAVALPLAWALWGHVRSRRRWVLTEEKLISEGGTPGAIALSHLELLTATTRWTEWHLSTRSSQSPPLELIATSVHPREFLVQLEKQGVTVMTVTEPGLPVP